MLGDIFRLTSVVKLRETSSTSVSFRLEDFKLTDFCRNCGKSQDVIAESQCIVHKFQETPGDSATVGRKKGGLTGCPQNDYRLLPGLRVVYLPERGRTEPRNSATRDTASIIEAERQGTLAAARAAGRFDRTSLPIFSLGLATYIFSFLGLS